MKETILFHLTLMLFVPASVWAQTHAIDEGSYRLGGSISFMSQGGDL